MCVLLFFFLGIPNKDMIGPKKEINFGIWHFHLLCDFLKGWWVSLFLYTHGGTIDVNVTSDVIICKLYTYPSLSLSLSLCPILTLCFLFLLFLVSLTYQLACLTVLILVVTTSDVIDIGMFYAIVISNSYLEHNPHSFFALPHSTL